jgi:rhodanese-related sulfurtransferase
MDFFLRHWEYTAIALLSGGMLAWSFLQGRFSKLKAIGPAEVTRLINSNDAVLLDVREPREWDAGHAPGAQPLPLGSLHPDHVPAGRIVVAVCRSGNRSRTAADALARAGLEVRNMAGGMQAWQSAGLPVVRDGGGPGTVA